MKIVKRILLALSGITAVLGIACIISGFILGGGIRPVIQNIAAESGRSWEHFVERLQDGWSLETWDDWDGWQSSRLSDPVESRYAAAEKLEIDVRYGGVTLVTGEGEDIVVRAQNISEDHYSAKREGNTLKIKDSTPRYGHGADPCLEIQVPEGYRFADAELEVGAGVLTADTLSAEKIQAQVGSGRLEVTGRLRAGEVQCSVGAGEIQIAALEAQKLELECAVGSAAVTLAGTEEEYGLEASCGLGTIQFGEHSYTAMKKSRVQEGQDKEIEAECGVGTVLIQFEEV